MAAKIPWCCTVICGVIIPGSQIICSIAGMAGQGKESAIESAEKPVLHRGTKSIATSTHSKSLKRMLLSKLNDSYYDVAFAGLDRIVISERKDSDLTRPLLSTESR